MWTHPWGTHELRPTNPRVISIDLHPTLDEFHSFPKPYGIRRIPQQASYTKPQPNILAMWNQSISNIEDNEVTAVTENYKFA